MPPGLELGQSQIDQPGSYTQGHAAQKLHQHLRSRPAATGLQPAKAGFALVDATLVAEKSEYRLP